MDLDSLVNRKLGVGRADPVPLAQVVVGPIGVGKTTYRKTRLGDGFVHIDSADIFHELSEGDASLDFPDAFASEIEQSGRMLTRAALQRHLNIVLETPGHEAEQMIRLIDALKAIGYDVRICALDADRETCERRHAGRGDNVSSYWAAPIHLDWVITECEAMGAT